MDDVQVTIRVKNTEAVSPGFRFALGTVLVIAGLACAVAGFRSVLHAVHPITDDAMSELLLGLCVLCFGAAIFGSPAVANVRQQILGALAITSMALLFDWIAFVPGPRAFRAGASAAHPGGPVSSSVGRVAFGVGAVFMDLFVIYAWYAAMRLLAKKSDPDTV
jgi:predicted permease